MSFFDTLLLSGNGQQQGVNEVFVFNGDAGFRERLVQAFGFQVDFRADAFEAFLSVVYGVKAASTARSTWAVQMLEVALSRRICCSLVYRARR